MTSWNVETDSVIGGELTLDVLADEDVNALQVFLDDESSSSDDALHRELVSMVSDDSPPSPTGRTSRTSRKHGDVHQRNERRRLQLVASARRHRSRKKHELADLQDEAAFLETQLALLRSQRKLELNSAAIAEWEERAALERHERRRTEALNEQLRSAVYMQSRFVRDLRTVFSSSPMINMELNLQQLLHSHTRLGCSPAARLREYQSSCSEAKLDLAMQILVRETAGCELSPASISTRKIRLLENQFGMTSVGAYAINSIDRESIFRAASSAILGFGYDWPKHSLTKSQVRIVESPSETMRYGIVDSRYKNDVTSEVVVLGGRLLSYYRVTSSYIVLVWDFVDIDDLHPLQRDTSIRRDVTGALLVRQEMCEDGVERVVCRSICTKVHTFAHCVDASPARAFADAMKLGAKVCGGEVYDAVQDATGGAACQPPVLVAPVRV